MINLECFLQEKTPLLVQRRNASGEKNYFLQFYHVLFYLGNTNPWRKESERDLRGRRVAPQSESPIGIRHGDIVKLVGRTDRRLLLNLLDNITSAGGERSRNKPHRRGGGRRP